MTDIKVTKLTKLRDAGRMLTIWFPRRFNFSKEYRPQISVGIDPSIRLQ